MTTITLPYTIPHYIQQLWLRWPLQPFQKTQLQPAFGPSVDSLCHPCITTTHLCDRVSYVETSAFILCDTTRIINIVHTIFRLRKHICKSTSLHTVQLPLIQLCVPTGYTMVITPFDLGDGFPAEKIHSAFTAVRCCTMPWCVQQNHANESVQSCKHI